jgi:histidyl-tRNA synthetase
MANQVQTLKGFRDIMPEEMIIRQRVINILRQTFESFGFQPIATPTLEYADVLLNKYGVEADKLVYTFKDLGARQVGLRYDLTVPVARYLTSNQNEITYPFKRYQIQNVFRADKPQRGRFREFTQCDIDTFGISSPLADAEIALIIYTALTNLGFEKFTININDRKLLTKILNQAGIDKKDKQAGILQSIDKLDKQSKTEISKELRNKGFEESLIKNVFEKLGTLKPSEDLNQIFSFLEKNNVNKSFYQFTPNLIRGLDYYTGPVFEAVVTKPAIGSIGGGGRYDNLVNQIGGPNITGTGFSFGLERVVEVIKDQNLWENISNVTTKVLVTVFSTDTAEKSISVANKLRQKEINTELYLNADERLDRQLDYANKKNIPWVVIIGPDEAKSNAITLKNMKSGNQKTLYLEKIIEKLA